MIRRDGRKEEATASAGILTRATANRNEERASLSFSFLRRHHRIVTEYLSSILRVSFRPLVVRAAFTEVNNDNDDDDDDDDNNNTETKRSDPIRRFVAQLGHSGSSPKTR